jgi:hypothetical protein
MKVTYNLIVLLLILPGFCFAQLTKDRDVIGAAGDHSSTATLQVSWTVGEVAVSTAQTANLIITEGFQQGEATVVAITEVEFEGSINVFPNPVEDVLNFEVLTDEDLSLSAIVYDMAGRKVREAHNFEVFSTYRGTMNFADLAAGKWLIQFTDDKGKTLKTFTVVKVK